MLGAVQSAGSLSCNGNVPSCILIIDVVGFKFYQLAICLPFSLEIPVAPFLHSFANVQAPPKPTESE